MDAWLTPHATLAFFALALTIISFWVKRSPWIWGGFLVISLALGFFAQLLAPIAFVSIGALFLVHGFLSTDVRGFLRFLLFLTAVTLSITLLLDKFPGFASWPLVKSTIASPGAPAFKLNLTFATPIVGLFVLAWGLPLNRTSTLKFTFPLALASACILLTLAHFLGLIHWDPKLPKVFWIFALQNLLFVTLIQEVFWRGFVQRSIARFFGGRNLFAQLCAVLFTALAFGAYSYFLVNPSPALAILATFSALLFGSIYSATRSIEVTILTHWIVNLTHFLLFTYPFLKSA